jgi:CRP/FNR family transcriptional regulator, cyclic AMP receptor protein
VPATIPGAQRCRLLARCRLFRDLPAADLDLLAARALERRYAHGRTIFARGEPGSCMFAVAEGRVRLGVTSAEGREVLLAVLGPGEVFGELALLDGGPRSADATALGGCLLLSVDRRELLPLLRRSPEAAAGLFEVVCARLRAVNERLEGAEAMPVGARLARLLLALADREGAAGRVDPALSQGDLGRLAGASRQKVNLHLSRWAAEGVLARDRGGIRVVDRGRLRDVAEAGGEDRDGGEPRRGGTAARRPGDGSTPPRAAARDASRRAAPLTAARLALRATPGPA